MIIISGISGLVAYLGKEIGVSDWLEVSQARVDLFANATQDYQWIHTDPERCREESPYKKTVAHGFFTLSYASYFMESMVKVEDVGMWINYGLDKVRFMRPLYVNSKLRMRVKLTSVDERESCAKFTFLLTFEASDQEKPVCKAESLVMLRNV